jgi:undecaprenyl-diphosphatase
MGWLEALILGVIQALTEFLPVSSSGHLELGKAILGVENADDLTFSIIVHMGTALSTLVVFRADIQEIIKGLFAGQWNENHRFALWVLISMIPAGIVGIGFKDEIETTFAGNLFYVGLFLLFTAFLLVLTLFAPRKQADINPLFALLIGIAQAVAILPGVSRSGATVSTALYLGIDPKTAARFSFLMVLPLIVGATLLDVKDLAENPAELNKVGFVALLVGFLASFVVGIFACQAMIKIVQKGKLFWFAIYCAFAGILAILFS